MATYRFDEFQLQPDERRLLRNGVTVSLPPRAFDVLVFLVEHAGSLVAKNEILGRVWRDTAVEEANLCVAISAIRRVIGHDAVVTVPKSGYRFAAELHRDSRADGSPAPALAATPAAAAAPIIYSNSGLLLGLVVIAVSAAASPSDAPRASLAQHPMRSRRSAGHDPIGSPSASSLKRTRRGPQTGESCLPSTPSRQQ